MTTADARAQLAADQATCGAALFRCGACLRADAALSVIVLDDPYPAQPVDPVERDRRLAWWASKMAGR